MQVIKIDLPFFEKINGVEFTLIDDVQSISSVITKEQTENFLLLPNFILFVEDVQIDPKLIGMDGNSESSKETIEERRLRLELESSDLNKTQADLEQLKQEQEQQALEKGNEEVKQDVIDEKAKNLAKAAKGKKNSK